MKQKKRRKRKVKKVETKYAEVTLKDKEWTVKDYYFDRHIH